MDRVADPVVKEVGVGRAALRQLPHRSGIAGQGFAGFGQLCQGILPQALDVGVALVTPDPAHLLLAERVVRQNQHRVVRVVQKGHAVLSDGDDLGEKFIGVAAVRQLRQVDAFHEVNATIYTAGGVDVDHVLQGVDLHLAPVCADALLQHVPGVAVFLFSDRPLFGDLTDAHRPVAVRQGFGQDDVDSLFHDLEAAHKQAALDPLDVHGRRHGDPAVRTFPVDLLDHELVLFSADVCLVHQVGRIRSGDGVLEVQRLLVILQGVLHVQLPASGQNADPLACIGV